MAAGEARPGPVIGLAGVGQLGGAIGRALLRAGFVEPDRLWIANRSGSRGGFEAWQGLHWTTGLQDLAERCDLLLLALPPAACAGLRVAAADRLVVSVMAGVTCDRLRAISGSGRVIRAMSSPAAELGLAYSPWYAAGAVDAADKTLVRRLFEACGATDEVPAEDQIDVFTAVTGPVPGFVALFARAMRDYAVGRGVEPAVADRAVRQLFLAGGRMLADSDLTPGEQVQAMIDYAGTTAAGMLQMQSAGLDRVVAEGLEAARRKSLTIAG